MSSDTQVRDKSGSAIAYFMLVEALVKDPAVLIEQLTPDKMDMIHMALGISGEAGELVDAIKKFAVYNKPLDRVNVVEELGDLRFYMQRIMNRLHISDAEILNANADKLAKRYSKGYTDQAAQDRADKLPEANPGVVKLMLGEKS